MIYDFWNGVQHVHSDGRHHAESSLQFALCAKERGIPISVGVEKDRQSDLGPMRTELTALCE